jgi:hypothetical protein
VNVKESFKKLILNFRKRLVGLLCRLSELNEYCQVYANVKEAIAEHESAAANLQFNFRIQIHAKLIRDADATKRKIDRHEAMIVELKDILRKRQ